MLDRHPKVSAVAVVGTEDPDWGQAVTAYVVPVDDPPSLDELRNAVRAILPAWCAPRRLVLCAELPRTALGKVARHRLSSSGDAPDHEQPRQHGGENDQHE